MAANAAPPADPVPTASQLVVLPFLAAVEGYVRGDRDDADFRLTMHRSMVRNSRQYLQQIADYLGNGRGGAGRVYPTDVGIVGAAYHRKKVYRTKHYEDSTALLRDLQADMESVGDARPIAEAAKSYLAVPFVGSQGGTVLVLYLDSQTINRFSGNDLVTGLVSMCHGFARLIQTLHASPINLVRNFALVTAKDAIVEATVYPTIQESLDAVEVPTVTPVSSFNFESAAD